MDPTAGASLSLLIRSVRDGLGQQSSVLLVKKWIQQLEPAFLFLSGQGWVSRSTVSCFAGEEMNPGEGGVR